VLDGGEVGRRAAAAQDVDGLVVGDAKQPGPPRPVRVASSQRPQRAGHRGLHDVVGLVVSVQKAPAVRAQEQPRGGRRSIANARSSPSAARARELFVGRERQRRAG